LTNHLVLAGGGHTHALVLHRWAMSPHLKPKGMVTLVNRHSKNIYSGMFPGVISKKYKFDCVQEPLAIYRQHEDQLQNKNIDKQVTQMSEWYEKIKLFF